MAVDLTGIRASQPLNEEIDILTGSYQSTIRVISLTRIDTTLVGGEESPRNPRISVYSVSVRLI